MWITGAELLAHVAGSTAAAADPADTPWAELVAASINADITRELGYPPEVAPLIVVPEWAGWAPIKEAALRAGALRWKYLESPFGIAGYDVSGSAIRLPNDDLKPAREAIARWGYQAGWAFA